MIITAAVVGKCNGDAVNVVLFSEVDWPPWMPRVVPSTRRCSHVTVNSVACRKFGTDLTCTFVERQVDICDTSNHSLSAFTRAMLPYRYMLCLSACQSVCHMRYSKFRYTGPTGPDQTRVSDSPLDPFNLDIYGLCPWVWSGQWRRGALKNEERNEWKVSCSESFPSCQNSKCNGENFCSRNSTSWQTDKV